MGDDHRRGAAVEPWRVARGDRAVLAKRRPQLREYVQRRIGSIRFVPIEDLRPLASVDFDSNDFRCETPCGLRSRESPLRSLGPAVLTLARDLVARDQILGVPARVLAREGVVEPVAQHAVVDLSVAHALAPAPA